MAQRYRVDKIYGQEQWDSKFGPMISWQLGVTNLDTNVAGYCEINSKPERPYKTGDQFWADQVGERGGIPKLKRQQPPREGGFPPQGQAQPGGPPAQFGAKRNGNTGHAPSGGRQAQPYDKALAVYRRFAEDLTVPEHATSMFIAWLRGDVADPTGSEAPEPQRASEASEGWPDDSESPF